MFSAFRTLEPEKQDAIHSMFSKVAAQKLAKFAEDELKRLKESGAKDLKTKRLITAMSKTPKIVNEAILP